MYSNDIDEIIKRGLQESESRYGKYATEAKERIWLGIEKPKKKSGLYWGFVLAMAAAITLLLVSTFLFLKLQSKEMELLALQTDRDKKIPSEVSVTEIPAYEGLLEKEKKPTVIEEPISETTTEKSIKGVKMQNLALEKEEEIIKESDPEIYPHMEALVLVPYPEIEVSEILPMELSAELLSPHETKEERSVIPNSKKQNKLRFRFGNSSQTFNSRNSLALNIKL